MSGRSDLMMTAPKSLTPEQFNKLGKYQKFQIVFEMQFHILNEIGTLHGITHMIHEQNTQILSETLDLKAIASNIDMKYAGLKEQIDVLMNRDFIKQAVEEKTG